MSERISLNRLYDKLNALGVAPTGDDHLGKHGNSFWVFTQDVDYADKLVAAIRRAGGRATVTVFERQPVSATVFAFIDDMFDDPNTRQPPLMQVDGWT